MTNIDPNDLYTKTRAAELLGLKPRKLRTERSAGRIGHKPVAGRIINRARDLIEWFNPGVEPYRNETEDRTSSSPGDAELLASRRFTTDELARLYNVPPPLIGDLSHFTLTNSETAGRWFAVHTLAPWIAKIEAEFTRSVFSVASRATHALHIDMSGFLRGDPETRWRPHEIAVKNDILAPNEVREVEGRNPIEGGDAPRTPEAPAPEARYG